MQENSDLKLEHTAQITAQDIATAQEFWRYWGTPLINAMLNAEKDGTEAMTRTLAYRHFQEAVVHFHSDCPQGKLIAIARREAVTDQPALEGLELCAWCQSKDRAAPSLGG